MNAYIIVKRDQSVGIPDVYQVVAVEIDDAEHREQCREALKVCFSILHCWDKEHARVTFADERLDWSDM